MKLSVQEMWTLLPLLRPDVEIEIVLHPAAATWDGAVARLKPETKAKQKTEPEDRVDVVAAGIVSPSIHGFPPAPTPEPVKPVQVKAFAEGGTPDQIQVAMLKAEVARMRAEKSGGV